MYETTVNVPSDFENIKLLCEYIELIYEVEARPKSGSTDVVTIRASSSDEMENAQNLALTFIGPESSTIRELPLNILVICTMPSVRRYLAKQLKLVLTVRGLSALLIRGSNASSLILNSALNRLMSASTSANATKLMKLQGLCKNLGIDLNQIDSGSAEVKSGFYDFLLEIEKLARSKNSIIYPTPIGPNSCDPAFIEVFKYSRSPPTTTASIPPPPDQPIPVYRAPRSASQPAVNQSSTLNHNPPVNTAPKRLRPIVIDGANVAHGESSNSNFNVHNLRCVITYFKQRGHEEISIFLPSTAQPKCTACFSAKEISRHFTFTPCRRLENGFKPQKADDDSVILEFARKKDAVVISNDQYRDWLIQRPEFRDVIENRVIPYTLRTGIFVLSHYPFGKDKPPLDELLSFPD
uniref:RNase_Zc3h12a domain-containing protein n=1 Tax=Mesocestoides corti TaxID=53468 RepID=A0A5K3EWI9_MESCO